jgi:hypothetical protein
VAAAQLRSAKPTASRTAGASNASPASTAVKQAGARPAAASDSATRVRPSVTIAVVPAPVHLPAPARGVGQHKAAHATGDRATSKLLRGVPAPEVLRHRANLGPVLRSDGLTSARPPLDTETFLNGPAPARVRLGSLATLLIEHHVEELPGGVVFVRKPATGLRDADCLCCPMPLGISNLGDGGRPVARVNGRKDVYGTWAERNPQANAAARTPGCLLVPVCRDDDGHEVPTGHPEVDQAPVAGHARDLPVGGDDNVGAQPCDLVQLVRGHVPVPAQQEGHAGGTEADREGVELGEVLRGEDLVVGHVRQVHGADHEVYPKTT